MYISYSSSPKTWISFCKNPHRMLQTRALEELNRRHWRRQPLLPPGLRYNFGRFLWHYCNIWQTNELMPMSLRQRIGWFVEKLGFVWTILVIYIDTGQWEIKVHQRMNEGVENHKNPNWWWHVPSTRPHTKNSTGMMITL